LKQRIEALFGATPRFTAAEFDQFFLENYAHIVSAAYRLCGDPDEAEDLAAEAFGKLWQDPPRSNENLLGWLYRVVTNLGYNRMRSSRRRTGYEDHSQRLELGLAQRSGPEEQVMLNQERAAVRTILKAMPRRDVQILILHACDLSYKEIAESLQVSPGSVGTLIARAERKFDSLYSRGEKHAPER
jgi:RNA polymerase sigma-70 factor (ECF subfamily)